MTTPLFTYRDHVKPALDRVAAAAALILSAPLLIVVAMAVQIQLGRPILFTQIRAGKHGRSLMLYKFRTMTDARTERGRLLPDAVRLTRFGRWLRATSLDELPELWNVLRGEMSLVGPRPLFVEYTACYSPKQATRLNVLPGLTGWAQVHGRNHVSWQERFELDAWYVRNQSATLDFKILLQTIPAMLSCRGISADAHATMPRFDELPDDSRSHARAA